MYTIFYIYYILLMIFIGLFIYLINYYFSMIKEMNYSKLTPFECGFSYVTNPNLPFSLSFYFINLMYLIFDIEVVMLLPVILNLNMISSMTYIISMIIFMLSLNLTLMYELLNELFDWIF